MNFDSKNNQFDKKSGKLITGFLHHLPFRADNIQTLVNPCKSVNSFFTPTAMQQYINTIGTTGIAAVPQRTLFQILNKASTLLGRRIEAKYPNG